MPPLSDKAKRWIGFALMILSLALGVYVQSVDSPPRWALAAGNALGVLGGLFGVGVMAVSGGPPKGAAVLALGLLLAAPQVGCNPYAAAWRATDTVRSACELTTVGITEGVRAKHNACKTSAAGDQERYTTCIGPGFKAAQAWRSYGVPTCNTAVSASTTAIILAERTRDKKIDFMSALRPAICALVRALRDFQHLLPAKALGQIGSYLQLAEGVTCG